MNVMLAIVLCLALAACTGSSPGEDPIGTATMREDGTIVLDLVAETGSTRGQARFIYPPDHEQYEEVVRHLGGLEPGRTKPVPPWPGPEAPGPGR